MRTLVLIYSMWLTEQGDRKRAPRTSHGARVVRLGAEVYTRTSRTPTRCCPGTDGLPTGAQRYPQRPTRCPPATCQGSAHTACSVTSFATPASSRAAARGGAESSAPNVVLDGLWLRCHLEVCQKCHLSAPHRCLRPSSSRPAPAACVCLSHRPEGASADLLHSLQLGPPSEGDPSQGHLGDRCTAPREAWHPEERAPPLQVCGLSRLLPRRGCPAPTPKLQVRQPPGPPLALLRQRIAAVPIGREGLPGALGRAGF